MMLCLHLSVKTGHWDNALVATHTFNISRITISITFWGICFSSLGLDLCPSLTVHITQVILWVVRPLIQVECVVLN